MDFSFTDAQRDLAGLARKVLGDWDERHPDRSLGGFDAQLWSTLARTGLLDAALPNSVGGGGFGLLEQCSVLIEIGRTVAGVPYASSISGAAAAIAESGDGRLAERWVVPVARGERTLAVALADPDHALPRDMHKNCPEYPVSVRISRGKAHGDDAWRLTGVYDAVPGAADADGFLCEASTEDGPALFVLDRADGRPERGVQDLRGAERNVQAPPAAPGVTTHPVETVDGAGSARIELEDAAAVRVEGPDPARVRQRLTVAYCAQQLGVVERALEMTAEYARTRVQFGHPIGSFQAVRQRLADAYLDVDAVRLTLWQAAWRLAEGLPADAEVATAKFWAAQAGHRVAHTCVHIHGAVGIDTDYPLHRYFAAAKRGEFVLGGATAQLRNLGKTLEVR